LQQLGPTQRVRCQAQPLCPPSPPPPPALQLLRQDDTPPRQGRSVEADGGCAVMRARSLLSELLKDGALEQLAPADAMQVRARSPPTPPWHPTLRLLVACAVPPLRCAVPPLR